MLYFVVLRVKWLGLLPLPIKRVTKYIHGRNQIHGRAINQKETGLLGDQPQLYSSAFFYLYHPHFSVVTEYFDDYSSCALFPIEFSVSDITLLTHVACKQDLLTRDVVNY